jgi:hypothetical protein
MNNAERAIEILRLTDDSERLHRDGVPARCRREQTSISFAARSAEIAYDAAEIT